MNTLKMNHADRNCDVSIIIPAYNPGDLLQEALRSIENNLDANIKIEIIIVDDKSTDPITLGIYKALSINPLIKIIYQENNGGPSKARNTGILASTGQWITFLDADDLMLPNTISKKLDVIRKVPDAHWVASDYVEMPRRDEMIAVNNHLEKKLAGTQIEDNLYQIDNSTEVIVSGYPIFFGCMMIKRELIEKAGLINADLNYTEDWHYTMNLSLFAKLYWIDEPLLCLRRHHESLTKNLVRASHENYRAEAAILADPRFGKVREKVRWRLAGVLRVASLTLTDHGRPLDGLKFAIKAIWLTPADRRVYKLAVSACLASLGLKRQSKSY